eukprot:gnl/Chilomastix_cuspidata/5283.p1 GENE.gnl/Chilomastix_cuspidata/5283~~gnl/Chilomastix_cuspidata/5283.p1  ORF type:complete len:1486 (-),score=364.23 gnl/Chilomastix_cuspidata/5283:12-4469(-)
MSETSLQKLLSFFEILGDLGKRDHEYKKAIRLASSVVREQLIMHCNYKEFRINFQKDIRILLLPSELYIKKIKKLSSLAPVTRTHYHVFEWLAKNRVLSQCEKLPLILFVIKSCKAHSTSQKTPLHAFKLIRRLSSARPVKKGQANQVFNFFLEYCAASDKEVRIAAFKTLVFLLVGDPKVVCAPHGFSGVFMGEYTAHMMRALTDFATYSALEYQGQAFPLHPLLALDILLLIAARMERSGDVSVLTTFHAYCVPRLLLALKGAKLFERLQSLRFDADLFPCAKTRYAPQVYLSLALSLLCFALTTTAPGPCFAAEAAHFMCAFAMRCDDHDYAPSGQTALRLVCANKRLISRSVSFSLGKIFELVHAQEIVLPPEHSALEMLLLNLTQTLLSDFPPEAEPLGDLPPLLWCDDGLQHFYPPPPLLEPTHRLSESDGANTSCLSECYSASPDLQEYREVQVSAKAEGLPALPYSHVVLEAFLSLLQHTVFYAQRYVADKVSLRSHMALRSVLTVKDYLQKLFRRRTDEWLCSVCDILMIGLDTTETLTGTELASLSGEETLLGILQVEKKNSYVSTALSASQINLEFFQMLHLISMKAANSRVREYAASRMALFVNKNQETITPFLWNLFHRFSILQGVERDKEPTAIRVLGAQACLFRFSEPKRDFLPFLKGLTHGIFSNMGPVGRYAAYCRMQRYIPTDENAHLLASSVCNMLSGYLSAIVSVFKISELRQQHSVPSYVFVDRSRPYVLEFFNLLPKEIFENIWELVTNYCGCFGNFRWRNKPVRAPRGGEADGLCAAVREVVAENWRQESGSIPMLDPMTLTNLGELLSEVIIRVINGTFGPGDKTGEESGGVFSSSLTSKKSFFPGLTEPLVMCLASVQSGSYIFSDVVKRTRENLPPEFWDEMLFFLNEMENPIPFLEILRPNVGAFERKASLALARSISQLFLDLREPNVEEQLIDIFFKAFAQAVRTSEGSGCLQILWELTRISVELLNLASQPSLRRRALELLYKQVPTVIMESPEKWREQFVDAFFFILPLQLMHSAVISPNPALGVAEAVVVRDNFPSQWVLEAVFSALGAPLEDGTWAKSSTFLWATVVTLMRFLRSDEAPAQPGLATPEALAAHFEDRARLSAVMDDIYCEDHTLCNASALAFADLFTICCSAAMKIVQMCHLGRAHRLLQALYRFQLSLLSRFRGDALKFFPHIVSALLSNVIETMQWAGQHTTSKHRQKVFSALFGILSEATSLAAATLREHMLGDEARNSLWESIGSGVKLLKLSVFNVPLDALGALVETLSAAMTVVTSPNADSPEWLLLRRLFDPFFAASVPTPAWDPSVFAEAHLLAVARLLMQLLTPDGVADCFGAAEELWGTIFKFLRDGNYFNSLQPSALLSILVETHLPAATAPLFFPGPSLLLRAFAALGPDEPTQMHLHVVRPLAKRLAKRDAALTALCDSVDVVCDVELLVLCGRTAAHATQPAAQGDTA